MVSESKVLYFVTVAILNSVLQKQYQLQSAVSSCILSDC